MPADDISVPELLRVPTDDGSTVHAAYYPPANHAVTATTRQRPPLILQPHPGPTSHTPLRLDLRTQFFTSRGFAIAAVDYRGSTGYGRAYRTQLDGQWGVLDVQDCVDVAAFLAERGSIDANRVIISGSSAGGFPALQALTAATSRFVGGASWYGITDLVTFRAHVPRFQRHHTDHLVGLWPDAAPVYRERSPVHNAAQITQPILVIYGLEDDIVPPEQAEAIIHAMRRRGVPVTQLASPTKATD